MSRSFRSVTTTVVLVVACAACGSTQIASDGSERTTEPAPPSTSTSTPEVHASSSAAPTTIETEDTTRRPTTVADVTSTTTASPPAASVDPADVYLVATAEIYRRTLPDGQDFVVRLSSGSYASVFGLSWSGPTGSADECLGDYAMFLGVPGDIGSWGSAWTTVPWFDETDPTQPVGLQAMMHAAEESVLPTELIVIRVGPDAGELVLVTSDGAELDRAPVANGVGMVMLDSVAQQNGWTVDKLRVAVIEADGQRSELAPVLPPTQSTTINSDCGPGPAPQRSLPEAGTPPADAGGAEAEIRQRYGLLVDQSVPADQKPDDLLDDDTGVQAALVDLEEGPYAEAAATAVYTVGELVFTQPDEAWFRYTITTSSSVFADRFGRAVFNGSVWQITRATLCQDLALALALCEPDSPVVELPINPEWEAAWREWVSRAMLYTGNDGCAPLSQC